VDGLNLFAFVGGNTISFIDIRGYGKQKPKQKAQQKKSKIKKQPDKKTTKTKYQVGQHGFKKKEQKRLQEKYKIALSGSTHESEHTVGFEPLNQTSGLKRGTAGVARTLENTAPAYQEVKELHRQHIGTGTHSQRDESGFNSAEYRQTQRSLIEQREVGIAVQINQLGYAFDPNFRKLATTTEFQAATDSFNVMVENLNSLEFLQGINPVNVAVTPKQKVEMYLSRFVVIKGRYPTKQEEEDAKKKFGVT
jgi:hypothetical protein